MDSLPSVNTSEHKKKLIVHTWERLATISIGNIPDRKNDPSMLAKQFRTSEGEPIHEIQIRGHRDTHLDDVRKVLEKGPEEIEKAVGTLPSAMSDLEEARLRIEEKGDRRTAIVTIGFNCVLLFIYFFAILQTHFSLKWHVDKLVNGNR